MLNRTKIKQERLAEEYKKVISKTIVEDFDDKRLKNAFITITNVKLSKKLEDAEVYFTILKPEDKQIVLKVLQTAAPFFFSKLKNHIKIKSLPKIYFKYDEQEEKANNVVDLINTLKKEYSNNNPER